MRSENESAQVNRKPHASLLVLQHERRNSLTLKQVVQLVHASLLWDPEIADETRERVSRRVKCLRLSALDTDVVYQNYTQVSTTSSSGLFFTNRFVFHSCRRFQQISTGLVTKGETQDCRGYRVFLQKQRFHISIQSRNRKLSVIPLCPFNHKLINLLSS